MIKPSTKIKRGTPFILKDTGEEVKFYIIDSDGNYLVDFPNGTYQTFSPDELRPSIKPRTPISKKPKQLTKAEVSEKKELNIFFASEILEMPFNCENCGFPLYAYTSFEKRCTIAHILEKKKFKSVATHPQNKLFLCAKGGCHSKFDNSTAKERSQLKVYALAIERYNKIKSLLTEAEIVYAEKYLNIK